jgi:hypothetical protein
MPSSRSSVRSNDLIERAQERDVRALVGAQ